METTSIHKVVMRRVYYSYVLSIFTHTVFWQGVFLGAAAILLARWLHVASIIKNFLSIPVGQVPSYLLNSVSNALAHGEVLMVMTLFLAVAVAASAAYHILHALVPRLWLTPRM